MLLYPKCATCRFHTVLSPLFKILSELNISLSLDNCSIEEYSTDDNDRRAQLINTTKILSYTHSKGFKQLVVPCSACYNQLAWAQKEIPNLDHTSPVEVTEDTEVYTSTQILNLVDFVNEIVLPRISSTNSFLQNKRIACFYGCLVMNSFDSKDTTAKAKPLTMEAIFEKLGATPINWAFKTECCGAGFASHKPTVVARLCANIFTDAMDNEADIIAVACPLCYENFLLLRQEISRIIGKRIDIQVFHFIQLLDLF